MNYEELSDEELVKKYKAGDPKAQNMLIQRYSPVIKRCMATLYLIGGDKDDLMQEGRLGLMAAVRDYDTTKQIAFFPFAKLCISRMQMNAVEASRRLKNKPLSGYVSISENENNEKYDLKEILSQEISNPEEILIDSERTAYLRKKIDENLSLYEKKVLSLHMQGYDYRKIAETLEKKPKSVDNALQRIRLKIRHSL